MLFDEIKYSADIARRL